jgi:hypothetical protein
MVTERNQLWTEDSDQQFNDHAGGSDDDDDDDDDDNNDKDTIRS